MKGKSGAIAIRVAKPDEYVDALWLLNAPLDEPQRRMEVAGVVQAVSSGETSLDYLLVAKRGMSLVGVVYGSPLPGGVAIVKPAQLAKGESDSLAVTLHEQLEQTLSQEADLLQALVDRSWERSIQALRDSGFNATADLKYLLCESEQFPGAPPPLPFDVCHYSESRREELVELVDETYRDTMDFPILNNQRDLKDVLAGYQATGKYKPERWLLLEQNGQLCGCVLFSEHPDKLWELVYMGIVPEKRGKGWGIAATRWGQWLAHQQGCKKMILAVDADNTPAVRMYAEAGFKELDSRFVMLKFLRGNKRVDDDN